MLSFESFEPGKSSPTVSVGQPTIEASNSEPPIVSFMTFSRLDASCAVTCCNRIMVVNLAEYRAAHVVRRLSKIPFPDGVHDVV